MCWGWKAEVRIHCRCRCSVGAAAFREALTRNPFDGVERVSVNARLVFVVSGMVPRQDAAADAASNCPDASGRVPASAAFRQRLTWRHHIRQGQSIQVEHRRYHHCFHRFDLRTNGFWKARNSIEGAGRVFAHAAPLLIGRWSRFSNHVVVVCVISDLISPTRTAKECTHVFGPDRMFER